MNDVSHQPAKPAVLVVEAEPLLMLAAVDTVERLGFEAIKARSAAEAVAILEARPDIRIMFTDIDMPHGLDGMQLAACVRDRWPPIEIILTSAGAPPDRALGSELNQLAGWKRY